MEATGAEYRRRRAPLVTRVSVLHAVEMAIGAIALIILLEEILQFSLFDQAFWAFYFRGFQAGFFGTLGFVAIVLPIGLGIGFLAGWARVSRFRFLSWPASLYVDFFRGVPPLVLVIFAFLFGVSLIPQPVLDRFFADVPIRILSVNIAAVAIALHSGAYQAEIFRAGFQSVPKGQQEAAQALGMTTLQSMRHVILPQTFRLSLPPLGNELAAVIKDTSLLAAIAGGELVGKSKDLIGTISFQGLPIHWLFAVWTAVAIAYFVMTFAVTRILGLLERSFHTPGLEAVSI